jgi:hypothetical protein
MQIRLAHLRERSTSGGWINFAVFQAKSISGGDSSNRNLLAQLTAKVKASGLRVDQSALAFEQNGRTHFYGSKNLVDYLAKTGISHWTHTIEI